MKSKIEIKYPVKISISCPITGKGKLSMSRVLDDERYAAVVEVVLALVHNDSLAGRACDALVDSNLVKGPLQIEMFKDAPAGDGEPYDDGSDEVQETEYEGETEGEAVLEAEEETPVVEQGPAKRRTPKKKK